MSGITHPKTLIRRSVRDRLKQATEAEGGATYPTPAADRVYAARSVPIPDKPQPLILIYTDEDKAEGELYQDTPRRVITLTVCCAACKSGEGAEEALEDLLDEMDLAAYLVVMSDPYHGGNAQETNFIGSNRYRDYKGSPFYGEAKVEFQVVYGLPDPSTAGLDDFLRFHADYDLAPADGNIDATDDVSLPAPEA
jgi:hypothetical protein